MAARGKIRIDRFLLAIIAAAVTASLLPARGVGIPILEWATRIAIFILFFLYGARLHPRGGKAPGRRRQPRGDLLAGSYGSG